MTKITKNKIELFATDLLEKLNTANMPYLNGVFENE